MNVFPDRHFGAPDPFPRKANLRGRVIVAPATAAGTVSVQVFDDSVYQTYDVPASNWQPTHDGSLPAVDDTCLLCFDHYQDPWLVMFG